MPSYHVTLKARLTRGTLYWVTDIEAADEDEALGLAEELFLDELDDPKGGWKFDETNVETS